MSVTVEIPVYKVLDVITLNPKITGLIIVDMQNDFAHPNGKLFVPEARSIVPNIKKLLDKARASNVTVIYTQDCHMKDDPEFKIWGEHAVEGTWGFMIVDELKPEEDEIIVRKLRYDAFYGTPLDHILKVKGIKDLIIVGTVANICVLHTAGSAALRMYRVIIPVDGIAALTDFDKHATLRQVDFLYKGVIVRSVNGIRFM